MTGSGAGRFTMTDEGESVGLWLVGLGPGDLGLMTREAVEVARSCDKRYLEGYTAVLPADQEGVLEEIVGPWERLMRPSIESPAELMGEALVSSVALMVVGDPLQATTHVDLEAWCSESGVGFNIVPGLSATSLAVSLSGLQSYKFGRQVTIPYKYGEYLATSPLEMVEANYSRGLHTLVLLDLDPTGMGVDKPTPMKPSEAVSLIGSMAEKCIGEGVSGRFSETSVMEWDGFLLSDIGTDSQRVLSGSLGELSSVEGGLVHTLIIPAEMGENERDAYERRRPHR